MRKQLAAFTLCGLMLFSSGSQVFATAPAADTSSVVSLAMMPRMDYIAQANGRIYIDSDGIATVSCSVYGYQGTTTHVKISANLQQYKSGKWVSIKNFTVEDDSHRTSLSKTYKISKGYSYRVRATITAYSGSSVETRTVTSSEASY